MENPEQQPSSLFWKGGQSSLITVSTSKLSKALSQGLLSGRHFKAFEVDPKIQKRLKDYLQRRQSSSPIYLSNLYWVSKYLYILLENSYWLNKQFVSSQLLRIVKMWSGFFLRLIIKVERNPQDRQSLVFLLEAELELEYMRIDPAKRCDFLGKVLPESKTFSVKQNLELITSDLEKGQISDDILWRSMIAKCNAYLTKVFSKEFDSQKTEDDIRNCLVQNLLLSYVQVAFLEALNGWDGFLLTHREVLRAKMMQMGSVEGAFKIIKFLEDAPVQQLLKEIEALKGS